MKRNQTFINRFKLNALEHHHVILHPNFQSRCILMQHRSRARKLQKDCDSHAVQVMQTDQFESIILQQINNMPTDNLDNVSQKTLRMWHKSLQHSNLIKDSLVSKCNCTSEPESSNRILIQRHSVSSLTHNSKCKLIQHF